MSELTDFEKQVLRDIEKLTKKEITLRDMVNITLGGR